ncbi:GNAT family N-acetyltransferase [Enterococcus gallinarum]|uniref:GNAT family N-acetyltransferase n=1 Tax=Enterococcus TaxID=1350 RepID=UPI003D6AD687
MEILITDAANLDFIKLTKELDENLNGISADRPEEERTKYASFNELSDITKAFVMYDKETAIGCAAFKKYATDTVEVKRVFISKNYRGKGLSKILLSELEKQVKNDGFSRLILETGKNNRAAVSMYKGLDYREIDNFPPYTEMKDSICLNKDLY